MNSNMILKTFAILALINVVLSQTDLKSDLLSFVQNYEGGEENDLKGLHKELSRRPFPKGNHPTSSAIALSNDGRNTYLIVGDTEGNVVSIPTSDLKVSVTKKLCESRVASITPIRSVALIGCEDGSYTIVHSDSLEMSYAGTESNGGSNVQIGLWGGRYIVRATPRRRAPRKSLEIIHAKTLEVTSSFEHEQLEQNSFVSYSNLLFVIEKSTLFIYKLTDKTEGKVVLKDSLDFGNENRLGGVTVEHTGNTNARAGPTKFTVWLGSRNGIIRLELDLTVEQPLQELEEQGQTSWKLWSVGRPVSDIKLLKNTVVYISDRESVSFTKKSDIENWHGGRIPKCASVTRLKDSPIVTADEDKFRTNPFSKLLFFVPNSETEMVNFLTYQEVEEFELSSGNC